MRMLSKGLLVLAMLMCVGAQALDWGELAITEPFGWRITQTARNREQRIVVISGNSQSATLFVQPGRAFDTRSLDASGVREIAQSSQRVGPLAWQLRDTFFRPSEAKLPAVYVRAFSATFGGNFYYGFSRASDRESARKAAQDILESVRVPLRAESLTGDDYRGRKHYFGWGAVTDEDPLRMHNEVAFDVRHTHAIFTRAEGGDYLPTTFFGKSVTQSAVEGEWRRMRAELGPDDMFVQYSSGHGEPRIQLPKTDWMDAIDIPAKLGIGIPFQSMAETVLALPAREVIIFTMACFSGELVDAINRLKASWQFRREQGRTLFVMTSSLSSELSWGGPQTDPNEPNGGEGSAGSAFGFSLWKSLSGEADGFVDGVRDGYLSLGEIRDYTSYRVKNWVTGIGKEQTPIVTGSYDDALIMNRVPSRQFLSAVR